MTGFVVSDEDLARAVAVTKKIASVPAGPFKEHNRHPVIQALLREWVPSLPFAIDGVGNIVTWLEAAGKAPPIVVSAHLDTVFPLDSVAVSEDDKTVYGAGTSDDASGLAAILFVAAKAQAVAEKAGRGVIFAFTVGEEGAGGLRGIRHLLDFLLGRKEDAALQKLLPGHAKSRPSCLIAVDGTLATVVTKGLHIKRRKVSWSGPGGHSWGASDTPSAILAAAQTICSIYHIRTRCRHTTVNVGTISGGTTVNSIAANCSFEVEVRSVSRTRAENVMARIAALAQETSTKLHIPVAVESLDDRAGGATRSSHKCVKLLEAALRAEGLNPVRAVSSTEANVAMAEGIPSVATGVALGSGIHTLDERFDKASFLQGLRVMLNYVAKMME